MLADYYLLIFIVLMQARASSKQSTLCMPEDEEEMPLVKRKTEEEYDGSIFAKKRDLKSSFYLSRKLKKDKTRKLEAASFDNPFIKMKMQTSQSNRNSRKLALACIEVGLRYTNPQSAPTSTKRKLTSSLSTRSKPKRTHEHPNKKEITEQRDPPRSLVKKQKPYVDYLYNHTLGLLQKMKSYKSRKDTHPAVPLTRSKRLVMAPRTFEIFRMENEDNTTFWPFSPYKTIKDRIAKNKESAHFQALKQAEKHSHFKL